MAFTLIGTTSTSVISLPVREALLASIERCGRAVLLVDTLDTKKTVQKLLAADPVLSLGLTVSTLFEWTEEFWRLFGNGHPLITGELRKLCIFEALESFEPCAEWLRQLSNLPKVTFIVPKIKGHGPILLRGKSECLPSWIDILN